MLLNLYWGDLTIDLYYNILTCIVFVVIELRAFSSNNSSHSYLLILKSGHGEILILTFISIRVLYIMVI